TCTYDVGIGLEAKPSFINKTVINATITNTGTCSIQNIEIKSTPPLDAYIVIENGRIEQLEPLEDFEFAIKLKTSLPSSQQKQPLQGYAVKEPRNAATRSGKIIVTGHGVKGLGLEAGGEELKVEEELALNIEVYELERNSKNSVAATIIGTLVLLGLLGMLYRTVRRGKKDSGSVSNSDSSSEISSSKKSENETSSPTATRNGEEKAAVEKPLQEQLHEHEKGTPGFEEGLKRFEEKWKEQQQNLFSEKGLSKNEHSEKGLSKNEQHEKGLEGFRETFK
ncbi:MAG: hypothetical protein AABX69_04135, partial [Nanoarchaeota archaeon]